MGNDYNAPGCTGVQRLQVGKGAHHVGIDAGRENGPRHPDRVGFVVEPGMFEIQH